MPMWGVEVFQRRVNFGEDCTVTLMVEVGAAEKPDPVPMTPVVFEGLEVSIFPNKAGGLSERWSAEAIADIQQRPGPKTDTTPSGTSGSAEKDAAASSSKSSTQLVAQHGGGLTGREVYRCDYYGSRGRVGRVDAAAGSGRRRPPTRVGGVCGVRDRADADADRPGPDIDVVAGRGIRVVAGGEPVMARGEKVGRGPIHLRAASVRVPLSAVILGWLGRFLGRAIMRVLSQPVLWAALTVYGIGYWLAVTIGPWPFVIAAAVVVGSLVAWRQAHRDSFRRWFAWPVRCTFRRAVVYRRFWQPAMVTTGLAVRRERSGVPPETRQGRLDGLGGPGDRADAARAGGRGLRRRGRAAGPDLRRRRLPGPHRPAASRPAHPVVPGARPPHRTRRTLGQRGRVGPGALCRWHVARTGWCTASVCSARTCCWSPPPVRGSPGRSGRSSTPSPPASVSGLVQLWVCDPKGGMELAGGQRLFTRFCHGAAAEDTERAAHEHAYAGLLEDAVTVMRDRQARLRGVTRLHEPSTAEPLIVVVIDELAALTAYLTDRDAKKRISAALSLLLSQGRAVGVLVVAALQDPRKDVLPARDLFPTRIALRVTEPEHVDMTLGDGARKRGARCDHIPEALPGVGYVALDGIAEPVRVRFAHITDAHITALADQYAIDTTVQPLPLGPGEAA